MTNPDNTTREVYKGRELDCTVAGLSPGRPYIFQVRAHNKSGVSERDKIEFHLRKDYQHSDLEPKQNLTFSRQDTNLPLLHRLEVGQSR